MDDTPLYRQIAESFRKDILSGRLKPGDRLPSVRDVSETWGCTVGTIQRAYQDLVRQGLVTSRAGQGTRVVEGPVLPNETPLRRAMLIHRAEAFLLEVLNGGYAVDEVEQAVRQALDRWRMVEREHPTRSGSILRFAGSHDLAMTWLASRFDEISPGYSLHMNFTGSLGGLIALVEGEADLAGIHLWDAETGTYNIPFVRRVLPGEKVALINLAQRRLGLILPSGNPENIQELGDLFRPGLRFINRQSGSGTRVWLDAMLKKVGAIPEEIHGYDLERMTHSAVAQAVAEGQADVGISLEAAAISFGLDFVFQTHDRYDLAVPESRFDQKPMEDLLHWLKSQEAHEALQQLGGYDTIYTGTLEWIE
jgi:molybdate-binding protein/DNA-binding transcriptional regulator YhcF (GntR family)